MQANAMRLPSPHRSEEAVSLGESVFSCTGAAVLHLSSPTAVIVRRSTSSAVSVIHTPATAIDQVTRRIARNAISTRIDGLHCQDVMLLGELLASRRLFAKAHGCSGAGTCLQAPGGTFMRKPPSDTATHRHAAAARRDDRAALLQRLPSRAPTPAARRLTQPRCGMRVICDVS